MQKSENLSALRNLSALVDFSNLINSSLKLDFILNNLLLTCFGKFHTTKGLVAVATEEGTLKLVQSKGITEEAKESFPAVNINDLPDSSELNGFINDNGLKLCREIISTNGNIGLLLLGKRLGSKEYEEDDKNFINTIVNIAATAIENTMMVERLKNVNRDLDLKVNQLSSLFDLSKEFSGILEDEQVTKLLSFSIIGQLLVSRYAVVFYRDEEIEILDSKINNEELLQALNECDREDLENTVVKNEIDEKLKPLSKFGAELIVPMKIKNKAKGLIILCCRIGNMPFTKSDIEYVSSVGSLAIISLENARLFQETLEKQRLEKDLEIARNIQQNLLPSKLPELEKFEIAAYNNTARQVGGDYYDIVELDEKHTLIAIADVSGKGVQAALLMANVQAFLKSICKQNIPLDQASNLINDLVSENTTMGSFITFFWAELNRETNEFTYVNAGHNPPLLFTNGEMKKLKKGGMILGVMETVVPYESETVQLHSGDYIVMFTDGITEAMDTGGNEYSDEKLEELTSGMKDKSAREVLDTIVESVREFSEGAEQSDDITSLVLKVK